MLSKLKLGDVSSARTEKHAALSAGEGDVSKKERVGKRGGGADKEGIN